MPECYKEFMEIAHRLENHYRDMQDMEFTIQEGKLYFLQTRNGKRTAPAAIKIACDLVDEGKITPEEAVKYTLLQMKLRLLTRQERELFWFVLRHLQRILKVCTLQKEF